MRRFALTRSVRTAAVLALSATLVASSVAAAPPSRPGDPFNTQGFRKAVTLAGIREHQAVLQAIADANNDRRLAGTNGYDASAAYVAEKAAAAGYQVTLQEFEFLLVADRTTPILETISPVAASFVDAVDFASLSYSGSGDVTAAVTAVDYASTNSGCEAADFAGFPAGTIALVKRGSCTFRIKSANAVAAGATAVVIANNAAGVFFGTLAPPLFTHPVVGTTPAVGDLLGNGISNGPTGVTARVRTDMIAETRSTTNVLADSPGGDPNSVIVVGAHLDSVARGPGINDNGSGSAAILEVAEQFAAHGHDARNKLRFAWWGAEEHGLLGSAYYVSQLSAEERAQIRLNLNFDMIGSPNFVRFVYDGDNSAFPPGPGAAVGPPGSGEIEDVFAHYFESQGLPSAETPFSGRSDYGPFIAIGIPAGGLFTGAEGIKTAQQAEVFGGVAGQQYDPCYHLACDTFANNSDTGLDQMSDAVAHAVLFWSKRNFEKYPLNDAAPMAAPLRAASSSLADTGDLHDDAHDAVDR